ncbi:MAG: hypothetical protein HXS40_06055 [Theionarchaea archaeon]|nr:hypothetical protein [Theionarchaea archaeon]
MLPEKLMDDIARFALRDVNEWKAALAEFNEPWEGCCPPPLEVKEFQLDYVFSRKHSLHNKTFIRLFVELYEELYGKELSRDIMGMEENFSSHFEVTGYDRERITVQDLIIGDYLQIRNSAQEYTPKRGDILNGKVIKWRKEYYFYGSLAVYDDEKVKQGLKAFTLRLKRMCQNATISCLEYFGDDTVIFQDRKELEEKFNDFAYWFFKNKAPPGVVRSREDMEYLDFEEVGEKKEIGLLIDFEAGQRIIPEYGYAVKILSGDIESVEDWETKAKNLLYTDDIPSFHLRQILDRNIESGVKIYSRIFPHIKTKDDLLNLFQRFRREWEIKPRRKSMLLEQ